MILANCLNIRYFTCDLYKQKNNRLSLTKFYDIVTIYYLVISWTLTKS